MRQLLAICLLTTLMASLFVGCASTPSSPDASSPARTAAAQSAAPAEAPPQLPALKTKRFEIKAERAKSASDLGLLVNFVFTGRDFVLIEDSIESQNLYKKLSYMLVERKAEKKEGVK